MKSNFLSGGKELNFTVTDFSNWVFSDLISNAVRGILAEFIIAKALGVDEALRIEWDAYDLIYKHKKIEVKSSAYIQSSNKPTMIYAKPTFGIGQKKGWYAETNTVGELKRHADLYIFCLFACKDWDIANPLNLDQWEFYILTTRELDDKLPHQKTIGIESLKNKFAIKAYGYAEIKAACDKVLFSGV